MVELKIYQNSQIDMPPLIRQQVVDFLRCEWPDGFQGVNRLRNWITPRSENPVNFMLIEDDTVISHIEVVWKMLEHNGIIYKAYGLTGVFTYPQFQKQGYGKQLLATATAYILKSDADLAMYHVDKNLVPFYSQSGWEPIWTAQTLSGDQDKPEISNDVMMALFLSSKGQKGRSDFETQPFYFGDTTW